MLILQHIIKGKVLYIYFIHAYRYVAGRPRTAVDYIHLTASVDSWVQGSSAVTESVFLPVRLLGASPNSAPTFVRSPGV